MTKGMYAKDIDLIEAMKSHKVMIKYGDNALDTVLVEITPAEATRLGRTCPSILTADVSLNQKYCCIRFALPSVNSGTPGGE